jgi:acetoin utilization deacetylase AcuC-like enzyme
MMPAVLAANGGVLAAARSAMDSGRIAGTLTSGLHHARREYGLGFCTFNGLAITAIELSGHGNVLILDLDAHGGGGTASLISGNVRIRHIDLSTDAFDCHEGTIDVSSASQVEYLERLESELRSAAPADIVIYNAGMDVHESDCGQLSVDAIAAREVMVFEWARSTRTPICYTLAGGYSERERLVGLHRCTIRAAEYHAR